MEDHAQEDGAGAESGNVGDGMLVPVRYAGRERFNAAATSTTMMTKMVLIAEENALGWNRNGGRGRRRINDTMEMTPPIHNRIERLRAAVARRPSAVLEGAAAIEKETAALEDQSEREEAMRARQLSNSKSSSSAFDPLIEALRCDGGRLYDLPLPESIAHAAFATNTTRARKRRWDAVVGNDEEPQQRADNENIPPPAREKEQSNIKRALTSHPAGAPTDTEGGGGGNDDPAPVVAKCRRRIRLEDLAHVLRGELSQRERAETQTTASQLQQQNEHHSICRDLFGGAEIENIHMLGDDETLILCSMSELWTRADAERAARVAELLLLPKIKALNAPASRSLNDAVAVLLSCRAQGVVVDGVLLNLLRPAAASDVAEDAQSATLSRPQLGVVATILRSLSADVVLLPILADRIRRGPLVQWMDEAKRSTHGADWAEAIMVFVQTILDLGVSKRGGADAVLLADSLRAIIESVAPLCSTSSLKMVKAIFSLVTALPEPLRGRVAALASLVETSKTVMSKATLNKLKLLL